MIRCVHKIGRGVLEVEPVRGILDDIRKNSRLMAKKEESVFAYRIDLVPEDCRDWVLVVFEVDGQLGKRMRYPIARTDKTFEYYEFPTGRGEYLSMRLLGFLNAPGYDRYEGPILFFDSRSPREV